MRALKALAATAVLSALPMALPLAASANVSSVQINSSVNVSESCTVDDHRMAMAFGIYDPIIVNKSQALAASPGSFDVLCTTGAPWSFSPASGSSNLTLASKSIAYSYALSPATGNGTGTDQVVSVNGSIAAGLPAVPEGTYTDTLTFTLSFT